MATNKSSQSVETILRMDTHGPGKRRWSLKGARLSKGITSWRKVTEAAHKPNPIIDPRPAAQNGELGRLAAGLARSDGFAKLAKKAEKPRILEAAATKVETPIHIEHIAGLVASARRIETKLQAALMRRDGPKAAKLAMLLERQSRLIREHTERAEANDQLAIGKAKASPGRHIKMAEEKPRPIMTQADQAAALAKLGRVLPKRKGHSFSRS